MSKINILLSLSIALLVIPQASLALTMPTSADELASMADLNAQSYVVMDADSGQIIIDKDASLPWTPASLTKLITALVVLDTKPKLTKAVAITETDEIAGACGIGGACLRAVPGIKFTVDGLFHAALMPSDNNAANALSRSTGLSEDAFVALMNKKAASLGAVNTHFYEPTGMDPGNQITAADYAKIVTAAFSVPYLEQIAGLTSYPLRSTNNSRYNQTIKNTDQLISDSGVKILGAKTGYLTESQYNFAALMQTPSGEKLAVVVLGEQHLYSAFDETVTLASLGQEAQTLALINNQIPEVLGTSTAVSINY